MKKVLMLVSIFVVFASFAIVDPAEASFIGIANTSVFSPVVYKSTTGSNTYANYNQWSSVCLGATNENVNILETATQPVGTYGVGVALAPLGNCSAYNVSFDYHFRTWDDAAHDTFQAVVTEGDYLWNGGTNLGGFTWGGTDRDAINDGIGKETNDIPYEMQQFSMNVTSGSDYYLNILLITTGDTSKASWGRFSDVTVEGIAPEPASLALFGLGICGFLGLRRKKN